MAKIITDYAAHAQTIADMFRAAFRTLKLADFAVDMTAPEETTHGGLLGLQHVTLKGPTGMALVAGTVHAGEKRAEIRSYTYLARVHQQRFKQPIPFDEGEYQAFLDQAETILDSLGLKIVVTAEPADPSMLPPMPSPVEPEQAVVAEGPRKAIAWFVVAPLALIVLGIAAWLALR